MDLIQIRKRCPSAEVYCRGRLDNWQLRYSRYSQVRKGGVADIVPKDGDYVLGLVVALDHDDLAVLDDIECSQNGYRRIKVKIKDDNQKEIEAFAYEVIDKVDYVEPTKVYQWLVYSGAYNLNAPKSYLKNI